MRTPFLAVLLLVACAAPLHAATPRFQSSYDAWMVTGSPWAAVVADFDGDGKADVATLSTNVLQVNVLFGAGNGDFATADTLSISSGGDIGIAAGDLDGDGKADLVTSDPVVSVFFSRPGRTFAPPVVIGAGYEMTHVADVTGDGKPDVITAGPPTPSASSFLYVYPGDGAGHFGAPVEVHFSGSLGDFLAADVNHDGLLDLVACYTDTLGVAGAGVRLSLGGGSFGPLQFIPIDPRFGDLLAVADFDEDGRLDCVFGNGFVGDLEHGLTGTVAMWDTTTMAGAVGDLNRDGHLDVVRINYDHYPHSPYGDSYAAVEVMLGHGGGSVTPSAVLTAQFETFGVFVADMDLDGRPDVVTWAYDTHQVNVFLATVYGDFGTSNAYATGPGPVALALADVTGDGRRDVVVAENGASALRLLPGIGRGKLGAPTEFATPPDVRAVAVGDVNGDGWPDLVCANGSSNSLSVFLGSGAGAMAPRVDYPLPGPGSKVVTGDLNGDGYADVAVLVRVGSYGGAISVWLGTPSGALGPRTDLALPSAAADLAIARVNGDAYPDVIASMGREVSYFPGNVAGALGARVDVTFASGPYVSSGMASTFGDVNGDGVLDVIDADTYGYVYARLGNGLGGFTALAGQYLYNRRELTVRMGDLDEDGKPDLVAPDFYGNYVTILPGDGAGKFSRPSPDPGAGNWSVAAELADMNGDGHLDIATVDSVARTVTVLLNRTPGLSAVGPTAPRAVPFALAFARVGPQPARGVLHVEFALPERGRAALELVDVAGRRVQRTELGELDAGSHGVGLQRGEGVRPGVYWLRLAQGANTVRAKVVFVD